MSEEKIKPKIIECPICRSGISRNALMCPTCGHDMRPKGPSNPKLLRYCPACGYMIGKKSFRCPSCGQRQMSDWQIMRLVISIMLLPLVFAGVISVIGAFVTSLVR